MGSSSSDSVVVHRAEIDEIDAEVARLLRRRGDVVKAILAGRDAVLVPEREAVVEGRVGALGALVLSRSKLSALEPWKPLRVPQTVIAGPCAVEGRDLIWEQAKAAVAVGVSFFRAGVWKPRTNPYSWQGEGDAGLAWMRDACSHYGLKLCTEVRDIANLKHADRIDVGWIGARNGQAFELLREAGAAFCGKPLGVKRAPGATVEEWMLAAEYARREGADVFLIERGVRSFDPAFRNMLDIAGAVAARRVYGARVMLDLSHSTGAGCLVHALANAVEAAGLDGVMVEAHVRPCESRTDAEQSLPWSVVGDMLRS